MFLKLFTIFCPQILRVMAIVVFFVVTSKMLTNTIIYLND